MSPSDKIRTVLSIMLLAVVLYFAWQTKYHANRLQLTSRDLAELRHVRYGLFNVELWQMQISESLSRRIDELVSDEMTSEQFRQPVEDMLYQLIDEMDENIRRRNMTTWGGIFKQIFMDIFIDLQDMKDDVPEYADVVLKELQKPQTQQNIKEVLWQELDRLLEAPDYSAQNILLTNILERHACPDRETCINALTQKQSRLRETVRLRTLLTAGSALLVFLLLLVKNPRMHPYLITSSVLTALVLLFCGVSMPMIDLELIITRLEFTLLGEPIRFSDQLLFYRSKSIWDLVVLMMSEADILLVFTGFLILLFSVLFPLSKMAAALILVFGQNRLRENRVLNFLVFRSGKWSMADVTVVAIFMAYIGFDSIVNSQMQHLTRARSALNLLSFNGTSLQYGFYLFLMFTIFSLIFSERFNSAYAIEK